MNNIKDWENKFQAYIKEAPNDDASHSLAHFKRVWNMAKKFAQGNNSVDELVLLAAAYFHDIVSYPKNHPDRALSSTHAAKKAAEILIEMGFPQEKIEKVCHCIEAHSFSANIVPKTMEAKIIQDADRMEALGAIGLARTFYVAGRMGSNLFHEEDPLAQNRELDDKAYALDHFEVKLLKLPKTMQTEMGKAEANKRAAVLLRFMADLRQELGLNP